MAVKEHSKHEQFAQLVSKGVSATKAYVSVGYSPKGARQSASRMLKNADVRSRVRELQEANSAEVITHEISTRTGRVKALQERWDRLRDGLDRLLNERGADMAGLPGGASGLLLRKYKGKKADRLVTRIDPAIISLIAELLRHERQAAQELGQWKTGVAAPQPPDASPATFTLASICTREELEEMERRALALRLEWELGEQAPA
jgi:Terminase small subunit